MQVLVLSRAIFTKKKLSALSDGKKLNRWMHWYSHKHLLSLWYIYLHNKGLAKWAGRNFNMYTHQNKHHNGLNLCDTNWPFHNSDTPKPNRDPLLMLMHVHTTMIIDGISLLGYKMYTNNDDRKKVFLYIVYTNGRPFDPGLGGGASRLIRDFYLVCSMTRK